MISLGNYYHFAASEIECVEVSTVKAEYPYRITVYLKSGASRSVNYKNEQFCSFL